MSKYLDTAGLTRLWSKIKGMFAPLASPALTGTPTAPTAATGTNTTQLATTAFVKGAVDAAAITIDTALSSTSTNPVQNKVINTALGLKANLASPTFTGTPKAPTAAATVNNTQIATTAYVTRAISNAALTIDTAMSDSSTNPVQNKVAKAYIDEKVSVAYKAMGSLAPSGIVSTLLVAANEGNVYNINAAFTTTSDFVEGAGKTYPAGTNIVVIKQGSAYKFDVLAGFVDLSNYPNRRELTDGLGQKLGFFNGGVIFLDSNHIGQDSDAVEQQIYQAEARNPYDGEFCAVPVSGTTPTGDNIKIMQYDDSNSTWGDYYGEQMFLVEGLTQYIDDGDTNEMPCLFAFDIDAGLWWNILDLFAVTTDLSRYAFLDRVNAVGMVYLDAAHWKVSSAPSNPYEGDFYFGANGTMYRYSGSAWLAYTGKGLFIGNELAQMGNNDDLAVPVIYGYDPANVEWVNILERVVIYEDLTAYATLTAMASAISSATATLTANNSTVKEVIRPTYVSGNLPAYSSTYADKWIFNARTQGNFIVYGNASTSSFDTPQNPDKLFLYDDELWQVIDGVPTRIGYTESITDAEIDTICV